MKSNISSTIKTILFDLDGTLLPMQQDEFTTEYFDGLSKKLAFYGKIYGDGFLFVDRLLAQ